MAALIGITKPTKGRPTTSSVLIKVGRTNGNDLSKYVTLYIRTRSEGAARMEIDDDEAEEVVPET